MENKKILHIAAHMGEGVGKAISGLSVLDKINKHEIILLEEPQKMNSVDYCRVNGVSVLICPDDSTLTERIEKSDIVLVSWWNHPSLLELFNKLSEIPARIMIWSHVNGLKYPQLPAKFALTFNKCLFTSPISLNPAHWTDEERDEIKESSELVYGMGEFRPYEQPHKKSYELHDPIRIGYVGTLDYSKMHPNYLSYCKELLNQGINARFVLAGEPSSSLIESVERENLSEKFEFLGFRKDISELLTTFDVFGYLLNPLNFATTENALLEAMAAGLPIITANSEAENAIITDGVNGFCAKDAAQYADRIKKITGDIEFRSKLATSARSYVCENYDVDDNIKRFNETIAGAMEMDKVIRDFSSAIGKSPFECFISSCPEDVAKVFIEVTQCDNEDRFCQLKEIASDFGEIYKSNRKGSVFHFSRYFPNDIKLKKVCQLFETDK